MFIEDEQQDTDLELMVPEQEESIIKVIGVGGGGSNAVNHMCRQGIHGVEFVICNTDLQDLRRSPVKYRVQIGKELTEGLGAGSLPERGRQAAEESLDYIRSILEPNTRMAFITAGMGGGTGTGAAPIIAKLARELGILTVGIVTIPFSFEGRRRVEQAMAGVDELAKHVDALLIICNDKLRDIYGNLKLSKAFEMADNVLTIAAKSIAEIITVKGRVNVDFADVDVVMRNSGVALMGAGEAEGENRALDAIKMALESPLLNCSDIRGASNILLNMLYGNREVTIGEQTLITDYVRKLVGQDVDMIWGYGLDESLEDKLRVAIIATGFHNKAVENRAMTQKTFVVEEVPDLEMRTIDAKKLEEEERRRKLRQAELRRQREATQQRESDRPAARVSVAAEEQEPRREASRPRQEVSSRKVESSGERRRGRNEVPDVNRWFQRTFGNLFNEDMNKDSEF